MRLPPVLVTQTSTEVFWKIGCFFNLLVSLAMPILFEFVKVRKRQQLQKSQKISIQTANGVILE